MENKIAINGASGRIGRSVTYELFKNPGELEVVLLNDPVGIKGIVASLSGMDPVHGKFDWKVEAIDDKHIAINGKSVRVTGEKALSAIPFQEYGVQIVEECSGFLGDSKKDPQVRLADELFKYGVSRVIQSYPANADAMLIMGVNHTDYDPAKHRLISNASCTTKAIAGPTKALLDAGFDVVAQLMDTVHAATNSQNILASLNQIGTAKTGAARATGIVIPVLAGKMDGLSYRVPTLDGSFANMYMVIASYEPLTAKRVNDIFVNAVNAPNYAGRIAVFTGKEASSASDIVGKTENAIVILEKTRVMPLGFNDRKKHLSLVSVVSGYDNERGPPMDQVLLTKYVASKAKQ